MDHKCFGCVAAPLGNSFLWNIKREHDGELMLGSHTDIGTASFHLERYRSYSGKPYPNGKGFYPTWQFTLVNIGGYWRDT